MAARTTGVKDAATAAKAALAKLNDTEKEAVAKAIVDFPEGCLDGKTKFMRLVGLPTPPKTVQVAVYIDWPVADEDLGPKTSYYAPVKPGVEKDIKDFIEDVLKINDLKLGEDGIDVDNVYDD
jgi:hypothetical protein